MNFVSRGKKEIKEEGKEEELDSLAVYDKS
jgi:hypothetical protein